MWISVVLNFALVALLAIGWSILTLFWPLFLIVLCANYFGFGMSYIVIHCMGFGLFNPELMSSIRRFRKLLFSFLNDDLRKKFKSVFSFLDAVEQASVIDRIGLMFLGWLMMFLWLTKRSTAKMLDFIYYGILIWVILFVSSTILGSEMTNTFVMSVVGASLKVFYDFYFKLSNYIREGRTFRKMSLTFLAITILNITFSLGLLKSRHNIESRSMKRSKIMRSVFAMSVKFIEAIRLPQMFRSPAELGMSEMEAKNVNEVVDNYLDWLRSTGYPVGVDVKEVDPIHDIAEGKYDPAWLFTGTSWRIHMKNFETYAQPEFRKFQHLAEEYKFSLQYANLDNQLEATARYFYSLDVNFPLDEEIVDNLWDMVKTIYKNSKITPAYALYKMWNKKFNVGVYATSSKTNSKGGMKKMTRREWISQITPSGVISAFKNFVKLGLVFDTHAQFFTKMEYLKPSKWMNDMVRTPIAMMLPEFVAQMTVSAEPNKRFHWDITPIKLGMPIKSGTFETMWKRHARFQKHYAGDCTAFDSTIVSGVKEMVKAIRKKGFESHMDHKRISQIIDTIYDRIEFSKLVSANSGNIYFKGSGLATGHASTSPDNSLVTVGLYLTAWKVLTGHGAVEFRYYNELSAYGDDHVLSISGDAPAIWTWDNITALFKSWGITMREEVPSNGKGVPMEALMFLRKVPRKPTQSYLDEFLSVFPGAPVPEWITIHDRKPLIGKLMAHLPNKDPRYRAKRLQSFMYLCAHHKDIYDMISTSLDKLWKDHPKVKKELAKYTPPYSKVMTVWYTSSLPLDAINADEDSVLDTELLQLNSSIVLFGEIGVLESCLGLLSKVPDLVTPAIRNIGPLDFIMSRYGTMLSWPKALIARANNIRSKGHLEATLSNTSYDWITKVVPWRTNDSYTTLVVRHYCYNILCETNPKSLAFYITGVFRSLITLNFILTGYVAPNRPKFAISYWNLILVVFLNVISFKPFVPLEALLDFVKIPDVVGFVDDLYGSIIAYICHHIFPASFADTKRFSAPELKDGLLQKLIVSAPTGSGKSTDMIYSIYLDNVSFQSSQKKLYVIVPRVNLAIGLAKYLNERFVWSVGYITGEDVYNDEADVVFITTGSFVKRHGHLFGKGNIFVHDEFHLDEVETVVVRSLLMGSDERVIFASATPRPMKDVLTVDIIVNKTYGYIVENLWLPKGVPYGQAYITFVLDIGRSTNPWMKHLVFVDSFEEMDRLAEILPNSVGEISSRRFVVENVSWILATSSADVGVTIPNVDVVITKTFSYGLGPNGMDVYKHSDSLLTQRSGRTGRTNNGLVYLVHPADESVAKPYVEGTNGAEFALFCSSNGILLSDSVIDQLKFNGVFPDKYQMINSLFERKFEVDYTFTAVQKLAVIKVFFQIILDVTENSGQLYDQKFAMAWDMINLYFDHIGYDFDDRFKRNFEIDESWYTVETAGKIIQIKHEKKFYSLNWKLVCSENLYSKFYKTFRDPKTNKHDDFFTWVYRFHEGLYVK